jgi:hypothetical protein
LAFAQSRFSGQAIRYIFFAIYKLARAKKDAASILNAINVAIHVYQQPDKQ